MNSMVFGKYLPLNSIIHRIDPRAKLVVVFTLLIALFVPKSWYVFGVIALFCVASITLAKISMKMVISAFKPMAFMMIFLLVINVLTVKTGDILFTIGSFSAYYDAVFNTLFAVVRIFLMVMVTTVLTATTKPLDLTLGIEHLLNPLKAVKFPVHEMAMMISIALRFIPTIIEETMRIMNAQKSRGVDFEEGKLKEKVQAILSLIVPLFAVAFQRAYELADAMEARGYVPGKERTRYKILKYQFHDFVYLFLGFAILAFSIASRFIW